MERLMRRRKVIITPRNQVFVHDFFKSVDLQTLLLYKRTLFPCFKPGHTPVSWKGAGLR